MEEPFGFLFVDLTNLSTNRYCRLTPYHTATIRELGVCRYTKLVYVFWTTIVQCSGLLKSTIGFCGKSFTNCRSYPSFLKGFFIGCIARPNSTVLEFTGEIGHTIYVTGIGTRFKHLCLFCFWATIWVHPRKSFQLGFKSSTSHVLLEASSKKRLHVSVSVSFRMFSIKRYPMRSRFWNHFPLFYG